MLLKFVPEGSFAKKKQKNKQKTKKTKQNKTNKKRPILYV